MAKPSDWNSDVLKGIEAVDTVINGAVTVGTEAVPIDTNGRDINWIILFNNGTATCYIGTSTVTTSNGLPVRPQGETPILRVTDLSVLYMISGSANQNVRYLAGVK